MAKVIKIGFIATEMTRIVFEYLEVRLPEEYLDWYIGEIIPVKDTRGMFRIPKKSEIVAIVIARKGNETIRYECIVEYTEGKISDRRISSIRA